MKDKLEKNMGREFWANIQSRIINSLPKNLLRTHKKMCEILG